MATLKSCVICGAHVDNYSVCQQCIDKANEIDVFDLVSDALGAPKHDSSKWVTWLCPFHSEKRAGAFYVQKQRNFYKCFACGASGGAISWMMNYKNLSFVDSVKVLLGVSTMPQFTPKRRKAPKAPTTPKTPQWLLSGENYLNQWTSSKHLLRAWSMYKDVPEEIVIKKRYGFGRLPEYASHCNQPRLIVPFLSGGRLIGVRARLLDTTRDRCQYYQDGVCTRLSHKGRTSKCAKWLSPAMPGMPLYNGARLLREPSDKRARSLLLCDAIDNMNAQDAIVHIMENPVDADLFEHKYRDAVAGVRLLAVATCGVTVWRDDWTKAMLDINPLQVQVVYDNDMAGNGNTRAARSAYAEKMAVREQKHKPAMGGLKLVNRLRGAGVPAYLFKWDENAEAGADVGSYL